LYRELFLVEYGQNVYDKYTNGVLSNTFITTCICIRTQEEIHLTDDAVPYDDFVRLLTPQRMAALRQQLPIDSLSPADGKTLNNILADPVSKNQLFPEGIIVSDAEIYDAHESNTCMLIRSCSACFVGRKASAYTSFSIGHVYSCLKGRIYNVDYYGPKDDSLILAHVSRHLPLAPEIWRKEPVNFMVSLKEDCVGAETIRRLYEFTATNIDRRAHPPRQGKLYSFTMPLGVPNVRL